MILHYLKIEVTFLCYERNCVTQNLLEVETVFIVSEYYLFTYMPMYAIDGADQG